MTIEINHRTTDEVLHTHDGGSLQGADLSEAILSEADLSEADLRGARVSPRADWLTLFGMVIDAEAPPKETE